MSAFIANIKSKKNYCHVSTTSNVGKKTSVSLFNIASKSSIKIFQYFSNYQSQTNHQLQNRINTMEISQSSNYTIAGLNLSMRRTESGLKRHWRLVKNGYDDSLSRITFDWFIDHLLYLWDLILGIVRPILTMFLIVIIQLFVTLVSTVSVIYAVYTFITF